MRRAQLRDPSLQVPEGKEDLSAHPKPWQRELSARSFPVSSRCVFTFCLRLSSWPSRLAVPGRQGSEVTHSQRLDADHGTGSFRELLTQRFQPLGAFSSRERPCKHHPNNFLSCNKTRLQNILCIFTPPKTVLQVSLNSHFLLVITQLMFSSSEY